MRELPIKESERIEEIARHYEAIIRLIGEDPSREGLRRTPMRAAKALWYCTKGYRQDCHEVVNGAVFQHDGSRMVIVKDIEVYSFCEHHILPFFGSISIGYIPDGKIIGISKLARLVDVFARRLQVQERLTAQICEAVAAEISPLGVIAKCNARHLCMLMRGVEKQDASTTTIDYNGVFTDRPELRAEFMQSLL